VRHLDLFSGIGGFALAAQWAWKEEHEIIAFVEIDKFCQKVLKKNFGDIPIYGDIKKFKYDGAIDLITGGFPCQPFSQAGKRGGKKDDRYLWPEMFRVIRETIPRWVIGENVAGIVNMELDTVLSDLEGIGYEVETFIIPACAVNAPHRRDRVWIVANRDFGRLERSGSKGERANDVERDSGEASENVADSNSERLERYRHKRGSDKSATKSSNNIREYNSSGEWWSVEPNVGRVANGVPSRVDRLKALGNAIVPQVVYPIMLAIKELYE
jgi:DNA (cytosine-5)-methyltransferase 1